MEFHLIVRHPFGDYSRGDRITDAETVDRLTHEVGDSVIRVAVPQGDPPPAD